jgi:hypothetical protein
MWKEKCDNYIASMSYSVARGAEAVDGVQTDTRPSRNCIAVSCTQLHETRIYAHCVAKVID